jgi:DNA-binding transcriptional ArsR family regulator
MDTFEAIADPTRRRIIELLGSESRNAGSIAAEFSVSRPAISRHLRVLRECGVVAVEEQAQQRIYHLNPDRLSEVAAWIARYTAFWHDPLSRLADYVESEEQ